MRSDETYVERFVDLFNFEKMDDLHPSDFSNQGFGCANFQAGKSCISHLRNL